MALQQLQLLLLQQRQLQQQSDGALQCNGTMQDVKLWAHVSLFDTQSSPTAVIIYVCNTFSKLWKFLRFQRNSRSKS